MATVTELLQPVEADLEILLSDLRSLIGAGHPILQAAAEHLFSAGGKRLRPGIVLLISRALSVDGELSSRHRRLAEITEMIHTASLVHDDVVDEASTRRGVETVHSRFNYRVAVLAGDFLFAQASWHLANLDNLDVVKLLSRVIMDLADGEVKQGLFRFDTGQSFETYFEKSYCKTASLIANSAKAAGVLSGLQPEEEYGIGEVRLDPGDVLLYYTDGVTEAPGLTGDRFDEARLIRALESACRSGQGSQGILDTLFERLDRFVGANRQLEDDASMVVLKVPEAVTLPNMVVPLP